MRGLTGTVDTVSVYHGSINEASGILEHGLDASRTPTWVTSDLQAAKDAVGPNRIDVMRDPGIIESRIPKSDFDAYFAPYERGYPGFYGSNLASSEIILRSADQINLFNQ